MTTPGPWSADAFMAIEPPERLDFAIAWLMALPPERRLDVFAAFCTHCGDDDPRCQCWNDE
jgi:hypothetical protein